MKAQLVNNCPDIKAKDALALIEHGHIDQPGGDLLQIAACNQSTPTGHGGHGDPFHVISKEGEGYVAGGYVKLKVVGFPSAGRSVSDAAIGRFAREDH